MTTALVLSGQHVARAADIPFSSQSVVARHGAPTANQDPNSVFAADLDGDGDLDLLTTWTDPPSGEIAWHENTAGTGTAWTEHTIDDTFGGAIYASAADVDGDGDLDVLVVSPNNTFSWYPNNGSGTFGGQILSAAPAGQVHLFPADVDGDGDLDVLLTSTVFGDPATWAENTNGAGNFTVHTLTTLTPGGRSVFAADMDGDGDLDALATDFSSDKVAWYANDGTPAIGTWSQHLISTSRDGAYWVVGADMDGDGDMDALASSSNDDKIAWHENTLGDGSSWTEHVVSGVPAPDYPKEIKADDMDGDGDLDVLIISSTDSRVAWYENTAGNGSAWTRHVVSMAISGGESVVAGDLDGDGDRDVISASIGDDTVAWYANKTIHRSATFPAQSVISSAADSAQSVFVADVDGDGDTDVLSASVNDNKIAWYENNGASPPAWTARTISTAAVGAVSVFAADLDGDGDTDVVAALYFDLQITWYENNGASLPAWTPRTVSNTQGLPVSVFATDMDGDGDTDVLSAEYSDKIAWYENKGASQPPWIARTIATTVDFPESVFATDVDGDGDIDVLSASRNDNTIAWFENNGASPPVWTARTISTVAAGARSVFAADVDGDGDMDVLSASPLDNTIAWHENNGASPPVWTTRTISSAALSAVNVLAADVDGDGDTDVLSASQGDDTIAWYENNGVVPPAWTTRTISTAAVGLVSVFAADVDGDGDSDVLSASYADDTIAWYENRGGQFALATTRTAPVTIIPGATDDLLEIVVTHNGRVDDTDVELATLELLFEESAGDPLTSAEANALIENLRVYLDNGSGVFESGSDTLVATIGTLALAAGVQTVTLTDGDPNVGVAQGTPRTYFVVVETTTNAATQVPNRFRVTHRTESSSTAEDVSADIRLSLEFVANLSSGFVDVPPHVIAVSPQDNALDAPVGTNVTVVFSEPVNPATVTISTFRLLAPSGLPLTASVGLSPDGKIATLDPSSALSVGTIYTVDVTSGVTNLAGTPALPFTSRFKTVSAVAGIPLSTVSDQSVLPNAPPFLSQGMALEAPTTVGANLGYSVASAGDLNNDGLGDFIGGAPGYAPGGRTEAGGVAVYLGSNAPDPPSGDNAREVAEIIFTGSAAHDRAGSSVAGGFDFDGDGIEDFLIGAEQVDRTQQPAVETGAGKVYLILFKPSQYDRSPVDGVPDYLVNPEMFISLDEVGSTISGVVFSGTALGDQAGYAVAGGGRLQIGASRDDIVIGAPGAGGDDGKVYVVFSDPALCGGSFLPPEFCGVKTLGNVGGSIAGVVYQGSSAERLGSSIALPGDVTTPTGPDIAMGAPDGDTSQVDAGKVYVAAADSLTSGTVNASSIATQVYGDQRCEHAGFAVAGGGDNRADGNPTLPGGDFDLLIGAPDYDPNTSTGDPCLGTTPIPDAGRVIQTSGRLLVSPIQASQVGTALPGIIWRGTQAGGHLGWSVARLGDMSRNVLEDIGLGAPNASPGISNAGAVYVIEGSANAGLLGTVDASQVGQTVSGGIFLGTQANERAGLVMAGVGDLDGDTTSAPNDFTVGSPGWDGEDGTVHQVLGSILQQPGQCAALGCTVADLVTGALLEVPPNALATQARFQVRGLVTPAPCSATSLAGKTLVGTSDDTRIDCESPPCPPPGFAVGPNIEVPARAEVEYQLVNGEALELRYCDATLGWRPMSAPGPQTGTVKANTFLPAPRKAVRASGVDTLHLFGVFFTDGDRDDVRSTCDCNDNDTTLWDRPFLVDTLQLSQNPTTGVTTLTWTPPEFSGGTTPLRYDTVKSTSRSDFVVGASCVEGDGTDLVSTDASNPTEGQVFYYIIVPQNTCPSHATCFNPDPRTPAVECTGS